MEQDDLDYMVLVNGEEQHSLWPTFKEIPNGWHRIGPVGNKAVCLAYIDKNWTDITPLSVRQRMASNAG